MHLCFFLVDLSTITEVRQWSQSFLAEILKKGYSKKQLDSPLNSRICFTIAFGKGEYNLVAPDEATCDFWRTTLQKLVSIVRAIQHENQYLMYSICALVVRRATTSNYNFLKINLAG